KTTSCPATSKPRSRPSSTTTTTAAITRASTISPRPTSTSDAAQPSWPSEKGSSDRPLLTAACSTGCRPPDFTNPMSQSLPYFTQPVVSETLTTDTPRDSGTSEGDPDPAAEEEKLLPRPKAPPEPKVTERLSRALRNVEAALLEPQFTAARPPELLGADIALAAILLVKGLADGHLEPELYRTVTRRLWSELVFG